MLRNLSVKVLITQISLAMVLSFPIAPMAYAGGGDDALEALIKSDLGEYVFFRSASGRKITEELLGGVPVSYDIKAIAKAISRARLKEVVESRMRLLNVEILTNRLTKLRQNGSGSPAEIAALEQRIFNAHIGKDVIKGLDDDAIKVLDEILDSPLANAWERGGMQDVSGWLKGHQAFLGRARQVGKQEIQYIDKDGAHYSLTFDPPVHSLRQGVQGRLGRATLAPPDLAFQGIQNIPVITRRITRVPKKMEILPPQSIERYMAAHGKDMKVFDGTWVNRMSRKAFLRLSETGWFRSTREALPEGARPGILRRPIAAMGNTFERWGTNSTSLPQLLKSGDVLESSLVTFARNADSTGVGFMMKFSKGFRDRVLADPGFKSDFVITMAVGMLAMIGAEYFTRADWNYIGEALDDLANNTEWSAMSLYERTKAQAGVLLNVIFGEKTHGKVMGDKHFVLADLCVTVFVDFALVYFLAPKRTRDINTAYQDGSMRPQYDPNFRRRQDADIRMQNDQAVSAGDRWAVLADRLYAPNVFAPGPYGQSRLGSFGIRASSFIYKGAFFAGVGGASGLVGGALAESLRDLFEVLGWNSNKDPGDVVEGEKESPDVVDTGLIWGSFIGGVSHTRYQLMAGATRVIENYFEKMPILRYGTKAIMRSANEIWGPMLSLDWMEFWGYKKPASAEEQANKFWLTSPFTYWRDENEAPLPEDATLEMIRDAVENKPSRADAVQDMNGLIQGFGEPVEVVEPPQKQK